MLPPYVRAQCNAKVNLYLKILGRRADGFHEIETVYHSISLHDTLTVSRQASGFSAASRDPRVPADMDNLALRAASHLLGGRPHGVSIAIEKRIPIGAGLGGGSADAAGALVCVNDLFALGKSIGELEAAAENIGSDVKFMIRGGCAIGRGRGEQLEHLPPLPPLPLVVVVPDITVSTAWAYQAVKIGLTSGESHLSIVANALGKRDVASLGDLLENDFESLVLERFPAAKKIKNELLLSGARAALLSGSGSCVYGLFGEVGDAKACSKKFSGEGLTAIVCNLAGRGVRHSQVR